jgi:hypothetical protein
MDSNHHEEIQLITQRLQAGGLPHIINLFLGPHPRDRRACMPRPALPKPIPTLYSVIIFRQNTSQ